MSDELEYVLDQDERIKSHLAKKDKIYELLNQNKIFLEKSINNIDDHLKDYSPNRLKPSTPNRFNSGLGAGVTPTATAGKSISHSLNRNRSPSREKINTKY